MQNAVAETEPRCDVLMKCPNCGNVCEEQFQTSTRYWTDGLPKPIPDSLTLYTCRNCVRVRKMMKDRTRLPCGEFVLLRGRIYGYSEGIWVDLGLYINLDVMY